LWEEQDRLDRGVSLHLILQKIRACIEGFALIASACCSFIGLALNNIFIMGLHVNAGTVAINTLGYTFCSALWGLIIGVIMYAGSLVRGFSKAEFAAAISAGTMLLCFFFVVIGKHHSGNVSDRKMSCLQATLLTSRPRNPGSP
jgi:uncharacterized membrane protein